MRIDCRCKECSKFTNEADTFLKHVPCDHRPACKCTECLRFYNDDGTWNEAKDSIQVRSGAESKDHTVAKQHTTSGELGTKTTSDESDQAVFDDYKKRQMQMPSKQIRIKLPAMRMLDTGEPADVQKLKTYVHELFGHLGYDTIFDACEMIDGVDLLKALRLLKVVQQGHCDTCAINKTRLPPRPEGKTTRPTREARVQKLTIDVWGRVEEQSIFHHYHYLLMGATEVGFILRCGLVFRSQSLFGVARVFNELGGSPVVTQVDSAGELTSKNAVAFYDARGTKFQPTCGGDSWLNGFIEKRIGVAHGLGRSMMWRAGLHPGYWYFAVSHAILIMNLMLRARTQSGVPRDITVWEAHYGQRPNVGELLLGPFGCLAYLILTKETRQRKGMSTFWGVRAIPGIYLGCEVNPRTMVYHHIITDGKTIFSSPNRIKTVPDVYPMRLQLESSPYFGIIPQPEDERDQALLSNVAQQHSEDREDDDDQSLTRAQFAALVKEAVQERMVDMRSEHAFLGVEGMHPKSKSLRTRNLTDEERRRGANKKRPFKVVSEDWKSGGLGQVSQEDMIVLTKEVDAEIAPENPLNYDQEVVPSSLDFIEPYDNAKYWISVPTRLDHASALPKQAAHPNMRFVGRKIRKYFSILDATKTEMWKPMEGVVKSYSPMRALFKVTYVDDDWEELDFEELQMILVMGVTYGDSEHDSGKTRAELNDLLTFEALLAEMQGEQIQNKIQMPSDTHTDDTHVSMHASSEDEDMPVMYDDEPRNPREVLKHRESADILHAGALEMKQMRDRGVAVEPHPDELDRIKREHKILRAKLVYKRKYMAVTMPDGSVREKFIKWKARLAIVGTAETEGVDCVYNTFSPTIGFTAIRVLISLMCDPKYDVGSYDLTGAFLSTDLKGRAVYCQFPSDAGEDANKIVRLVKEVYGLKSSGISFIKQLRETILSFEYRGRRFQNLKIDQCIYVFEDEDGSKMILAHYVDDIICGTTNIELRERFFKHLRQSWEIEDTGQLDRFLGINFRRSDDKKEWAASAATYIDRIVKRFDLNDTVVVKVPMDPGFTLTAEDFEEVPSEEMKSEYRSLIGSIGYCAITVRFDIAYAVSVLSRHLAKPCKKVVLAAKRVIKYLRCTRDMAIIWSAQSDSTANWKLTGSVDASFANCQMTRRSHGGWINFLNRGPVSWKSGLQPIVTLSSCEAEYVALSMEVCEVKYLRMLLRELGCPQEEPTLIWEDNKACILLAENESSSAGRCKHIDTKFRFVAEAISDGVVKIRYTPSAYNYSDILTKPLTEVMFQRMIEMCLGSKDCQIVERGHQVEGFLCTGYDSYLVYIY